MEHAMKNYSALSVGEVISIECSGERFQLTVLEIKPDDVPAICLYGDLDLEVDFAPAMVRALPADCSTLHLHKHTATCHAPTHTYQDTPEGESLADRAKQAATESKEGNSTAGAAATAAPLAGTPKRPSSAQRLRRAVAANRNAASTSQLPAAAVGAGAGTLSRARAKVQAGPVQPTAAAAAAAAAGQVTPTKRQRGAAGTLRPGSPLESPARPRGTAKPVIGGFSIGSMALGAWTGVDFGSPARAIVQPVFSDVEVAMKTGGLTAAMAAVSVSGSASRHSWGTGQSLAGDTPTPSPAFAAGNSTGGSPDNAASAAFLAARARAEQRRTKLAAEA